MATTTQIRQWWYLQRCNYGEKVPNGMFGRTPVYSQKVDFVTALEQAHFGAGYIPTVGGYIGSRRNCPSGIGGKTCEPSGKNCSLHNYGIAWDIEYNLNPHFRRRLTPADLLNLHAQGKTKYTPTIVDRILGVRNLQGETLFGWLGYSIGDTMHWQINVPPERSDVDWTTVPGGGMPQPPPEGEDVYLPLMYSDGFASNPKRKEDVLWLQEALYRAGFGNLVGDKDGAYGIKVASAVAMLDQGGDGRVYGAIQHDDLMKRAYGDNASDHTHPFSGNTGGPQPL